MNDSSVLGVLVVQTLDLTSATHPLQRQAPLRLLLRSQSADELLTLMVFSPDLPATVEAFGLPTWMLDVHHFHGLMTHKAMSAQLQLPNWGVWRCLGFRC